MSAHILTEFLPPPVDDEGDEGDDLSWLEGRSWVPEVFSFDSDNVPAGRKRRLRIADWTDGWHSEVPISERETQSSELETLYC